MKYNIQPADGTVFHMKNNAIYWPKATLQDYASKNFSTLTFLRENLIGKNHNTITCLTESNLAAKTKKFSNFLKRNEDEIDCVTCTYQLALK